MRGRLKAASYRCHGITPAAKFHANCVARFANARLSAAHACARSDAIMATTQLEKARLFQALHASGTFVIPNPFDGGSARLLAGCGFRALATSSASAAIVLGRRDGAISRAEALAHCRVIVEATELPVSGDLEKGFGDSPAEVAETIRLAAETGLVGGSIEDATGDATRPIFPFEQAVERVAAAVAAARALPFPFTLTARAENFIRGNPNLEDTIRRMQAFERAGADVLFAPALPNMDAVRAVLAAVTKPLNIIAGIPNKPFTVADLAAAGVRRISLGPSLHRAALTSVLEAAREVADSGTFTYANRALTTADMYARLGV